MTLLGRVMEIGDNGTFIELISIFIDTSLVDSVTLTEFYLCNSGDITYRGQNYVFFPFQISGLEQSSSGAPPRPKLALANVDKTFGKLSFKYYDIVGSKVTYIRTFDKYVTNGIGSVPISMEIYRKESHNKSGISFELRFPTDREKDFLPKKQMLKRDFPGMGLNKRN